MNFSFTAADGFTELYSTAPNSSGLPSCLFKKKTKKKRNKKTPTKQSLGFFHNICHLMFHCSNFICYFSKLLVTETFAAPNFLQSSLCTKTI